MTKYPIHDNFHKRKSVLSCVKWRWLSLIHGRLSSKLCWRDPVSFHFRLQHMASIYHAHFHQGYGKKEILWRNHTLLFYQLGLKVKYRAQDQDVRGEGGGTHLLLQKCLKYIYKWHNSHRTSTEHQQKTSRSLRVKKTPWGWVDQGEKERKKEKGERKELAWALCPREGAVREKISCTLGGPLIGKDLSLDTGGALDPRRREQPPVCGR